MLNTRLLRLPRSHSSPSPSDLNHLSLSSLSLLSLNICAVLSCFSCVRLFVTPWTVARQAPCTHTHAASISPRDSRHIATTGREHTEAQAGSEGHPWDGPSSEGTDACGQLQGFRVLLMGQTKPSSSLNSKNLQTLSV